MGYYSTVSGRIEIDPPLTWAEIQNVPSVSCLELVILEENEETPTGTFIRKTADAIECPYKGEFKAYSIVQDLQSMVSANPEHHYIGYFHIEGEETGDLWRMVVKSGKVEEIKPKIIWPE